MTTELGAFLRSRRAALHPEQVGVRSYGTRRVPGLRREELAQLAGVSVAYYTRLEQSDHAETASDQVIEALGRALQLNGDESAHLRRLARPSYGRVVGPAEERARASLVAIVEGMAAPAVVLDHSNDIHAWNRLGNLLMAHEVPFDAPHDPDRRPNFARRFFLGPGGTELYANAEEMADDVVGFLRYSSSLHPDDLQLSTLVGELTQRSDDFARIWAEHPVGDCGYGTHHYAHPLVGRFDLDYEVVRPAESSLRVLLYHAAPGGPAADALELLGHVCRDD
jgi:transcriptional regulator with XRE-family HTH domain